MHPKKTFKTAITLLLLGTIVYSFQSCTKENNPKPGAQYYFSADVNGTPWQANVEEAVDSAGGKGLVGLSIHRQDTSIMMIILNDQVDFSSPVTINNESSFADSTTTSIVIYMGNRKDTATYYVTPVTQGYAGAITVTQVDQSSQIIGGVFHATATNQTGQTIAITNGKFKMRITSSYLQLARNLMNDFGF
ncbi:MAG: hypothetical protein EPN39_13980 [Chitinophagaceae bacterium]|nr:MAG: hypothetical protein EPN39_13980 [Chitinophagaceae bacterium]